MKSAASHPRERSAQKPVFPFVAGGWLGGAFAGILIAYLESLFLLVTVGSFWIDFPVLLKAGGLYGLAGAAAGGATAFLFFFTANRLRPLRQTPSWIFFFGWILGGGLALEFAIYLLDIGTFRDFQGRWTILTVGALFAGMVIAGIAGWLTAKIFRIHFSRPGRKLLPKAGLVLLSLIAVFFLTVAVRAGREKADTYPISKDAAATRTNVIILLLDSLQADHLSAYGNPLPTSPVIDRLAREGVLFRDCVAASTWTVPTHASLFTGLYPSTHGGYSLFSVPDPSLPTLSRVLSAEGYRTGSFFDNGLLGSRYGLSKGFQTALSVDNEHKVSFMAVRLWDRIIGRRSASRNILRASARWIEQAGRERRPFFLFVNFLDTHLPYRPQKPYIGQFLRSLPDEKANEKLVEAFTSGQVVPKKKAAELYGRMTAADWRRLACYYDSNIRTIDDQIGAFLQRLRSQGLLENTLVIITADHGESMGQGGVGGHSQEAVERPVIRIPLILWLPGRLPEGEVAHRVSQTDILPTILKLAGLEKAIPRQIQGRDLFTTPPADREILSEAWDQDRRKFSRAYFFGSHKLVMLSSGASELYDLAADPFEQTDLSQAEPELLRSLQARLERKLASMPKNDNPASERKRKEMERLLRSLGYL